MLVLSGGCDRDHSRALDRTRKSADSWAATLDETVGQWAAGRVPTLYVVQVAEAAEKSLKDEAESLERVPADDPRARPLRERLATLRRRAHDIQVSEGSDGGGGNGS